ncbi:glycosyltransferase family 2 protein [Caulobacter sp. S45]|uniref:glycosyltransferase family 2 protein n=1 Tax=Caulobacter sp. S45 TaxID=1641861 RepID=UPI00131EA02B|nr:glycosyltransferase family 2 protein [Caulobacter sp. S45]
MTDLSIIIAAWNAEDSIQKAIHSALAQQGLDVEVLVADDASTDGTAAAVQAIDDPRLIYVRLPTNGGPAAARNAALDLAKGEWVAILDADDTMDEGRMSVLVRLGELHSADIVADNLWVDHAGSKRLHIEEDLDESCETLTLHNFLKESYLFAKNKGYGYLKPAFRREYLTRNKIRYDERLRIAEDFNLVIEALATGARYLRRRSAGYIYSKHASSISHRLKLADVQAMIDADERFIVEYGKTLTSVERQVMRRHLASLKDGAAFITMVSDMKARRWLRLPITAASRPSAIRLLAIPILDRLRRPMMAPPPVSQAAL